ncbi:MAG: cupredoxin domain-containing protein [Candidatus Competibacteraceae bacterium]
MKTEKARLPMIGLFTIFLVAAISAYAIAQSTEHVIKIVAKRFDYTPNEITLKKGVPVILEFTTADILMGFNVPDLGIRTDIVPGQVSRIQLTPQKIGSFPFHCDIFCGVGHEDMQGVIIVTD